MPNYCDYAMKIKGSKRVIERVVKCLTTDYDYSKRKPAEHKHFFRVFEAWFNNNKDEMKRNEDGTYTLQVNGYCAWSVHSCMCSGAHTYYEDCKKEHPNNFMGTTLKEQSKNCEIEVFSEEPGCMFSEHYLFKNGKCLIDDCIEISATEEDEDGDYEIINDNKDDDDNFLWEIE